MASTSRRSYLIAFLVLVVLTLAELGVVYVPGIGRGMLISALVLLAVAKAGLVLMSFMHLGHEARGLKWSVVLPLLLPAAYAAVLMVEAEWRFLR